MQTYRATLQGRSYRVSVEELDDRNHSARSALHTAAAPHETAAMSLGPAPHVVVAASKMETPRPVGAGGVLSPLAGKIVSVDVQLGQPVTEGAQVATIEAMKMNTYIFAPIAGKIESIETQAGDAVEEGALLLRIA